LKRIYQIIAIIILSAALYHVVYAWGFAAHKRINRMAVFTLPPEMIGFYKKNIDFVTDHAVDPDMRRYANPEEAPRHYIDVDRYSPEPFENLPVYWNDAVKKFTEDTLKAHGIVPWHINVMLRRLTDAFKAGNTELILHYSADIGHYIGDAHVPLHCTSNYNGQKTNQVGIHGFWEGRVPEMFYNDYDYFTGRSTYLEKPQLEAWKYIKASFAAHDSVLLFDRLLTEQFSADRKYSYEQRGANNVKVYSREYTEAYNKMLDGQVERRMRDAIIAVGSFWYTAWVDAGSPDLDKMSGFVPSEAFQKQLEEEKKKFQEGKIQNSHGHSDD
jgi:hypothetical protein